MARREVDAPVSLPLLDRLVDQDPKARSEPPLSRSQSMRLLREGLRRDLEWLLNTRRTPEEAGEEYPEVRRSVYNFGLPDLGSFSARNTQDQIRLRRALEAAIADFEPRLLATRVVMETVGASLKGVRFQIQGLLRIDPSPEHISFDTVLELPVGEFEVRGD
jgi:type VI secretion system protein ImpF